MLFPALRKKKKVAKNEGGGRINDQMDELDVSKCAVCGVWCVVWCCVFFYDLVLSLYFQIKLKCFFIIY
jgi:hypothetical protein